MMIMIQSICVCDDANAILHMNTIPHMRIAMQATYPLYYVKILYT